MKLGGKNEKIVQKNTENKNYGKIKNRNTEQLKNPQVAKKEENFSLGYESYSSTNDGTLEINTKKVLLSRTFNLKTANIKPKTAGSKGQSKTGQTQSAKAEIREFKTDEKTENKKAELKESTKENSEIFKKFKKKSKKIIEVFKEEALKTEKKIKALQSENENLRKILENPQLPLLGGQSFTLHKIFDFFNQNISNSRVEKILENLCITNRKSAGYPDKYELYISNWFDCLEIKPENYLEFISSSCIKIRKEQENRLKAEEDFSKTISQQEICIFQLEREIENLSQTLKNQ